MKTHSTIAYLSLLTSTLLASQRPEDVTAIWVGGSIQVSWLAPAEPPDIVHIQRRLDGRKDETWDVVSSKLGTLPGLPGQERNFVQDERVYLAPGEYSYRVAFGGKGGPWSRFAIEQNRPAGEAVATEPPPPSELLTRREGRTDFEKMQIASARAITPLPPRAERAPTVYPPTAPFALSVTCQPERAVLTFKANGGDREFTFFEVERTSAESETIRLRPFDLRPAFIAADNVTTYQWEHLVPAGTTCVYRVRAFSQQGDPSPWSEQLPLLQTP